MGKTVRETLNPSQANLLYKYGVREYHDLHKWDVSPNEPVEFPNSMGHGV